MVLRGVLAAAAAAAAVAGCAAGPTASGPHPAGTAGAPAGAAAPAVVRGAAASSGAAARSGADRFVRHLRGVHQARQLVVVTASGYGTSYATVRVFARGGGGWHRRFGPWRARIGRNGFAPRGDKREGDGRTPTGSFTVPFAFGVATDPGAHLRYRRARSTSRWDDDPASANYNRWVDIRRGDPGRDPEHMRVLPSYRYGVVIGYNLDRTPGRGSAIFFHVSDGSSTAGCVAVRQARVVKVVRWLRPARHPRFVMGTRSAVAR